MTFYMPPFYQCNRGVRTELLPRNLSIARIMGNGDDAVQSLWQREVARLIRIKTIVGRNVLSVHLPTPQKHFRFGGGLAFRSNYFADNRTCLDQLEG